MTDLAELRRELDRRGVELVAVGDRIRFRPIAAVTGELLDSLRTHKRELLAQLAEPVPVGDAGTWARQAAALHATVADPDQRANLRELFEHRSAVCEYEGNLDRDDAERIGLDELRDALRKAGESA